MMATPLIELENIHKIYRTEDVETLAVNNVSMKVNSGEYLLITGPSGGGKSTLLSIMGLLEGASSGRYSLAGQDITSHGRSKLAEIRNRELGFVFQAFNLIDDYTVFDNVALPIRYRKEFTKKEIKKRVEKALEEVDMLHRIKHHPSQLSGGQQQRVAIARAIIGAPKIIFADEPTGNLDSRNAATIMTLLKEQHSAGVTVCVVSHDDRHLVDATQRYAMLDGSLQHSSTVDSVVSPFKENHAVMD